LSVTSHYKSNLRDLEFNLFEVLDIGRRAFGRKSFENMTEDVARDVLRGLEKFATNELAASFTERPLPELSDMELLVAVARARVPPLRNIERSAPPGLARITARCMDADPAARYATAADLATDLRAWLAENVARALRPADLEMLMAQLFPDERSEIEQVLAAAG
jgi:hypothetical protein